MGERPSRQDGDLLPVSPAFSCVEGEEKPHAPRRVVVIIIIVAWSVATYYIASLPD